MKHRIKTLKRSILAALILALLIALGGCGKKDVSAKADAKPVIVCSIFPVYDFTRAIAGENALVYQLLPPGADSHEYEPSVSDIVGTDKADLFIYTDDEMEVWITSLKASFTHVQTLRCAEGIDLEALNEEWEHIEHGDEEEHEEEHEHEHKYDAHIWLDPTLAKVMCRNILDALIRLDPANEDKYRANCESYISKLDALDAEFEALFEAHPDETLYFGGKFSYSHFIRRYGAQYLSAYDGCGDEEEVNLASLIQIIEAMKRSNAKYVFADEMSNGDVARTVQNETSARLLLFHSCHTVSGADAQMSYIDLMERNLNNIRTAFGEG